MNYENPVLRGFYPDPSVCQVDGVYYMVCSSFQYFPGVPLFESRDLVNWKQLGHVLTRPNQVALETVGSSGGVFAPTIRYYRGRFYMTTTNNSTGQNFYVWTEDIRGAWSDPIYVDQDGIDPSLYFEDDKAYFMSNGHDDAGVSGIVQCRIDLATGEKLSPSRCLWQGTGGRFLEGPHLYRIHGRYYLLASEYVSCPGNPILTNRNKAPYPIQGIGHGELLTGPDGNWYVISLGFRQIGSWEPYHHLGREVFLTPARETEDGWFRCGRDGTTDREYRIPIPGWQQRQREFTFANTAWDLHWCYLRHPAAENYRLEADRAVLQGSRVTLDQPASPTFIGLRQQDMSGSVTCRVAADGKDGAEAGITLYMSEDAHYDFAVRRTRKGAEALVRLCVGDAKHVRARWALEKPEALLEIRMGPKWYEFFLPQTYMILARARTQYLSSEVHGGFTGVLIGLYAQGEGRGTFTDFRCVYCPEEGENE